MFAFVLIVPTLLSYSDAFLLHRCATEGHLPRDLWVTFAWFCLQTAAMALWVGSRLSRSPWWWCVLAWTILLIDLQVFALADSHAIWGGPATMLALAFVSAQTGLAVVWGLLGSETWKLRVPIAVGVLAWALSLGSAMHFSSMMLLLLGQTMATTAICLLLRSAGYRFAASHLILSRDSPESLPGQFSIRHLFFWTTALAIITAIARLLDWSLLLYLPMESIPHLLSYTALLMLVSMVATWAALGRENAIVRMLLGSLLLPAAGAWLSVLDQFIPHAQRAGLWMFWPVTQDRLFVSALWTSLAGVFLACILLVFRAQGQRLYRSKIAWKVEGGGWRVKGQGSRDEGQGASGKLAQV
jgi:hypothetical protein